MVDVPKLLEFCKNNPRAPHFAENMIKRFLTELVTNEELIFTLKDEQGLRAVAVLLDQVHNLANDACLEILALRADQDEESVVCEFILLAEDHFPTHRSGFQIGFHETSEIQASLMKDLGFSPYYETYVMRKNDVLSVKEIVEPHILRAMVDDLDEIYPVLCKAFAETPDTSIPGEELWKQGFLHSSNSQFYVWKEKNEILGFSNLILGENGEEAEIRTLGVLPVARAKGLGTHLLHRALYEAKCMGFPAVHLSVSVTNIKALDLYLQAGFKTYEKYQTYRKDIKSF